MPSGFARRNSKTSADNYLNTHNAMPSAEAAVAIARALGVSVEYLVTGQESGGNKSISSFSHRMRAIIQELEMLGEGDLQIVLALIKALKAHPRR